MSLATLLLLVPQVAAGELPGTLPQDDASSSPDSSGAIALESRNHELRWTELPFPPMEPGARLGQALAVGDFDGDGWQDLAASAPGAVRDGGRGQIIVLMAAPGGLLEGVERVYRVVPPAHQPSFESLEFGAALCICELDDDEGAELLIGAPLSGSGSGSVFVWGIGTLNKPAHMLLGPDALPGHLGASLAVGDFDGDGRSDMAMGAPLARHRDRPGGAVLLLGTSMGRRVISTPRPAEGAGFGSALGVLDLAPGAAVNLVVAAPDADAEGILGGGQVWIYSAGLRPIQPTLITDPGLDLYAPPSFGRSISTHGKTLLIGAPDRRPGEVRPIAGEESEEQSPEESALPSIYRSPRWIPQSGAAFRMEPVLMRAVPFVNPQGLATVNQEPGQRLDPEGTLLNEGLAPPGRYGLRVLAANLLAGPEPDALVVAERFFPTDRGPASIFLWPSADTTQEPILLSAPPQAGARWMQGLLADRFNGTSAHLVAGDPSFRAEGTRLGANQGRVMLGSLQRH